MWNLILWYKSNSHKLLSSQYPHPPVQTNSVLCQTSLTNVYPLPCVLFSPDYPHIEESWPIVTFSCFLSFLFLSQIFLTLVCQDPKRVLFFSWLFFIPSLLKQTYMSSQISATYRRKDELPDRTSNRLFRKMLYK